MLEDVEPREINQILINCGRVKNFGIVNPKSKSCCSVVLIRALHGVSDCIIRRSMGRVIDEVNDVDLAIAYSYVDVLDNRYHGNHTKTLALSISQAPFIPRRHVLAVDKMM